MEIKVREDFAAAGGCSTGFASTGLFQDEEILGVEFEKNAVATARAAGHNRLHADVRSDEVRELRWGKLDGYSAGPPCQTFSMAGNGSGREAINALGEAAYKVARGALPEDAIDFDGVLDERSLLVLEPMLVIHRHRPQWIILEQVPAVLPIWERYAEILRDEFGYSVDTGNLHAEQYGVPQTRKRAILVARFDGEAKLPTPTHSKFHNRSPERLDEGVQKWVSMAEALRWGMTHRPYPTVAAGTESGGGPDPQALGGSGARAAVKAERDAGRWIEKDDVRFCPTNLRPNATLCHPDEPAPTLAFGHETPRWVFVDRELVRDEVKPRVNNQSGTEFDLAWPADRPAPVIAGRGLVTMPGANANRFNGATKSRNDGIRVTAREAGILQSFPEDYPWSGGIGAQYQQIGNAMPPVLAAAVMSSLLADRMESK